jgi:hypothetical protein
MPPSLAQRCNSAAEAVVASIGESIAITPPRQSDATVVLTTDTILGPSILPDYALIPDV